MVKKKLEDLDTKALKRKRKLARGIFIIGCIVLPLWIVMAVVSILFFDSKPNLEDVLIFLGMLGLFGIIPEKRRIEAELVKREDD